MILSKPDILKELQKGLVDPAPSADRVDQVSVNLRLGRKFATYKENPLPEYVEQHVLIRGALLSSDLWIEEEKDHHVLKPGGFVLAQTYEKIVMPRHIMGFVEGRSTWARAGISAHISSPKIDPGFNGTITLEMTNHSKVSVKLVPMDDVPAQLMLARISTCLTDDELYGARPDQDVYQHQEDPLGNS